MKATSKQREKFIATLAIQAGELLSIEQSSELGRHIMRLGATYGRIAEELCNGYADWQGNWDEKRTKQAEAKQERIERTISELATKAGATADFQGDPRGYTIRLIWPRKSEYMAAPEVGVPTS